MEGRGGPSLEPITHACGVGLSNVRLTYIGFLISTWTFGVLDEENCRGLLQLMDGGNDLQQALPYEGMKHLSGCKCNIFLMAKSSGWMLPLPIVV